MTVDELSVISRRAVALSCTVVLAGSPAFGAMLAAPAGATATLRAPRGAHVVSATATSLTMRFRRAPHARRYRVIMSSVKSDVYYRNLHHHSRHARFRTARKARVHVSGLPYTTNPYYYRVAAVDRTRVRWAANYRTAYLRPPVPSTLTPVSGPDGSYLQWHSRAVTGFQVEQATDSAFTQDVRTYRTRALGPTATFTPTGLTDGSTYYFRIRAVNHGIVSPVSRTVSLTASAPGTDVKVLSYNTLDASTDGLKHPGATGPPFAQRRPGLLALMNRGNADVIGIQEGNSCIIKYGTKPCYRQVDSLAAGLSPRYTLDDTDATVDGPNRYAGNYILYDAAAVTPVGTGGHWLIGTPQLPKYAAYQVFRSNQTGATFLFVSAHLWQVRGHHADLVRGAETASMLRQEAAYASSVGVTSTVYTGDFNSYPNEWASTDLPGDDMLAAGFSDGIQVAQKLTNAQYDSINGLYRTPRQGHGSADHVFVSPGVGVVSWGELLNLSRGKFVGTMPSDHNPVVSTVAIP